MPHYKVHNLRLDSDVVLPSLKLTSEEIPDVTVRFNRRFPEALQPASGARLLFDDPLKTDTGSPVLEVWQQPSGKSFFLRYYDSTEFLIDRCGSEVWVRWGEESSFESAAAFLLGPVIGFVLRLRGVLCLHASVIRIGSDVIALTGPCGAGKSTLAASFATSGFSVLTDDVAALVESDGNFIAHPSNLQFKLWPDSVEAVYGPNAVFPRLVADTEKRLIEFPKATANTMPATLRAIFLLADRSEAVEIPRVSVLSPSAAMVAIISHTYTNYLLTPEMRKQEFEAVHRLVSRVPVRLITPTSDISKLGVLKQAICEEFTQMEAERLRLA